MVKKIISAVLTFTLVLSSIIMLGGCAGGLENSEIEKIYNNAIKSTLEQDVYFLKETVNNKDSVKYTQVNVLASVDSKYDIERNNDGSYKDLRIEAFEKLNDKETVRSVCGVSGDDNKNFLFTTVSQKNGEPVKSKKEISPKDYYNSEEFKKYRIETFIDELKYLKASDMDFTVEKGEAGTKGNVTVLVFKPTDGYLTRYEQETGKKSLFDGCKRVMLEISYGKISQIVVYREDSIEGSSLTVEVEGYKLMIVYYGPKIYLPDYKSDDWKNV